MVTIMDDRYIDPALQEVYSQIRDKYRDGIARASRSGIQLDPSYRRAMDRMRDARLNFNGTPEALGEVIAAQLEGHRMSHSISGVHKPIFNVEVEMTQALSYHVGEADPDLKRRAIPSALERTGGRIG